MKIHLKLKKEGIFGSGKKLVLWEKNSVSKTIPGLDSGNLWVLWDFWEMVSWQEEEKFHNFICFDDGHATWQEEEKSSLSLVKAHISLAEGLCHACSGLNSIKSNN